MKEKEKILAKQYKIKLENIKKMNEYLKKKQNGK